MKPLNHPHSQVPLPGASESGSPLILNKIIEAYIPGFITKKPDGLLFLKNIFFLEEDIEVTLQEFLNQLNQEFSFDRDMLEELLHGMYVIIKHQKLQSLDELECFLRSHQDMFRQIILEGMEDSANDNSDCPHAAE